MRDVYSNSDSAEVGYYKTILDEAGIESYIRNEYTDNPVIAGATFLPTLSVIDDADFDRAIAVLKSHQSGPVLGQDWRCPSCSESNPANFEICWKCRTPRTDLPA